MYVCVIVSALKTRPRRIAFAIGGDKREGKEAENMFGHIALLID